MADNQPAATPAVAAAAKVKNPSVEAGINAITSPAAEKSYYEGVQKKQDALSASQTEGLKKFGARMGDVESAQKAELSAMPKVEAPKETKFDHKGAPYVMNAGKRDYDTVKLFQMNAAASPTQSMSAGEAAHMNRLARMKELAGVGDKRA